MDSKLDINKLHTHLLKYSQDDLQSADAFPTAELKLSMFQFMLSNGNAVEVPLQEFIVLGRQAGNEHPIDIDLSDFGAESGVSRTHTVIGITESAIYVRDMESRNGTYLNGDILYPMQDYVLHDGDELKLGRVKLRVIFVP